MLELLLVIGILAILGTVGAGFYGSFSSNVQLDATARAIISDLKFARAKAIAGENRYNWGLHFVNSTSSPYYQFFSTTALTYTTDASTTVISTTTLGSTIVFVTPPISSSTDILFNAIRGTTTSSTITISRSSSTRSIYVSPSGMVN